MSIHINYVNEVFKSFFFLTFKDFGCVGYISSKCLKSRKYIYRFCDFRYPEPLITLYANSWKSQFVVPPLITSYTVKQLKEKCQEYNRPLVMAFVDYEKVFDNVERWVVFHSLHHCHIYCRHVDVLRELYSSITLQWRDKPCTYSAWCEVTRHHFPQAIYVCPRVGRGR